MFHVTVMLQQGRWESKELLEEYLEKRAQAKRQQQELLNEKGCKGGTGEKQAGKGMGW